MMLHLSKWAHTLEPLCLPLLKLRANQRPNPGLRKSLILGEASAWKSKKSEKSKVSKLTVEFAVKFRRLHSRIARHPPPGPGDDYFAAWDRVTGGYFEVIGSSIVKGRGVSEQDTATSRKAAVINEGCARKFFENEDPLGKHFGRESAASREFEVVGVAKDSRYLKNSLDKPIGPFFFLPET
jgi:hypothetical protein